MPHTEPPVDLNEPSRLRLFVLGDSISIHYGPFLEKLLAGRYSCDRKGSQLLPAEDFSYHVLQRLAELDPGIPEINGGDSASVLAYLQQNPPQCDVLLLNSGLHDLKASPASGKRQVEPQAYARNLEEILRLAQACARRVVWVRSTPVATEHHNRLNTGFSRQNDNVIAYNAIADAAVQRAGIPSIDLYTFTLALCEPPGNLAVLLSDHVHFTAPVRRLQGAYIAGWLEAYLD